MECTDRTCGRVVHPGWVSCAYCGKRLDDASRQGDTCPEDEHEFVIEGPHCVRCGYHPAVGGRGEQTARNLGWVVLITVCFLIALGTGVALSQVTTPRTGRVFGLVASMAILGMGYGVFKLRRIR